MTNVDDQRHRQIRAIQTLEAILEKGFSLSELSPEPLSEGILRSIFKQVHETIPQLVAIVFSQIKKEGCPIQEDDTEHHVIERCITLKGIRSKELVEQHMNPSGTKDAVIIPYNAFHEALQQARAKILSTRLPL